MEHDTIMRRTFSSILWMFVSTGWSSLASFLVFAVLARILNPFAFGVYALAQLVFQTSTVITTSGFGDAIIQQKDVGEELANSIFWANLAFSSCIALAIWIFAGFYGALTNEPEVAPVLRSLALALPIEALATVHMARKLKEFGYRVVALRSIAASLIGGGVAIAAASAGEGVWSLVLQTWITSILNAIFAWATFHWIPRLQFSWEALARILHFSSSVMLTRVLWLLLSRVPELFIGRALGAAAVGEYRVAWRLIELIGQTVLQPMGNVAFTTLSHLQDDGARFKLAYVRLLSMGALLALPLLFGAGVLADETIRVLFGTKWEGSAGLVRILAFLAVPLTVSFLVGQTVSARGSARDLMFMAAVQLVGTIIVSLVTAPFGLGAVSVGYVLRAYAMIPFQQSLLYKWSEISFSDCWHAVRIPLFAAGVMVAALVTIAPTLHDHLSTDVGYLTASTLIGGVVYMGSLLLVGRSFLFSQLEGISPALAAAAFRRSPPTRRDI
jgi:O-antigen/teichoic acid export membrane protein